MSPSHGWAGKPQDGEENEPTADPHAQCKSCGTGLYAMIHMDKGLCSKCESAARDAAKVKVEDGQGEVKMETAATKFREWKMAGRPEPKGEGQRFFLNVGRPGVYYVCDNSGDTPVDPDDGPLRIDGSRRVSVGTSSVAHGIRISVPVVVERYESGPRDNSCGVTIKELNWLLDNDWVRLQDVEIDEKLHPLRDLMARVFGYESEGDVEAALLKRRQ